ncbi:adenylate cyclase [bacterium]|nr:adenylate cyclase [bacterium]
MATEIERKYLVLSLGDFTPTDGEHIDQGYLSDGDPTVRVRLRAGRGYLTIKHRSASPVADQPIISQEFEYPIPAEDARQLLAISSARLTKTRHVLPSGIELDVFHGRHEGLVLAEFESHDGRSIDCPAGWQWDEVTTDRRYSNSWMARNGIPSR